MWRRRYILYFRPVHEIIEIYLEEEEVKDGIDIEKYWNIYIYFDIEIRNRLTRLKSAQQPPPSLRAKCCLTYLKYKCSNSRKAAARRIPIINKRKADKNCSSARGSLLFCTSLPGLHVPVIQYLLNRSKSPAILVIHFPFLTNACMKNGRRKGWKKKKEIKYLDLFRWEGTRRRESNWVVVRNFFLVQEKNSQIIFSISFEIEDVGTREKNILL